MTPGKITHVQCTPLFIHTKDFLFFFKKKANVNLDENEKSISSIQRTSRK